MKKIILLLVTSILTCNVSLLAGNKREADKAARVLIESAIEAKSLSGESEESEGEIVFPLGKGLHALFDNVEMSGSVDPGKLKFFMKRLAIVLEKEGIYEKPSFRVRNKTRMNNSNVWLKGNLFKVLVPVLRGVCDRGKIGFEEEKDLCNIFVVLHNCVSFTEEKRCGLSEETLWGGDPLSVGFVRRLAAIVNGAEGRTLGSTDSIPGEPSLGEKAYNAFVTNKFGYGAGWNGGL